MKVKIGFYSWEEHTVEVDDKYLPLDNPDEEPNVGLVEQLIHDCEGIANQINADNEFGVYRRYPPDPYWSIEGTNGYTICES